MINIYIFNICNVIIYINTITYIKLKINTKTNIILFYDSNKYNLKLYFLIKNNI